MKNASPHPHPIPADLKALISAAGTGRTKLFVYGFVFTFIAFTAFLAFNPSSNASSPWFYNLFSSSSASLHFFNSSSPASNPSGGETGSSKDAILGNGSVSSGAVRPNQTQAADSGKNEVLSSDQVKNGTATEVKNQTVSSVGAEAKKDPVSESKNSSKSETGLQVTGALKENQTAAIEVLSKSNVAPASAEKETEANSTVNSASSLKSDGASERTQKETQGTNSTDLMSSVGKSGGSAASKAISSGNGKKREKWIEDMIGCDMFRGHWVRDDSYPLYPEGSCPHIDEPFDCHRNGRPDRNYQKLRWQPDGCNIPRLNAIDMLERLRGKRLVFVGDSLNRNMWESLVCILKNSVKDKKRVFEASGRHEFRSESSYAFFFKDYDATIEFFRSPFLVQEWEMPAGNGTKETLRLDRIERSSSRYRDAHIIIFNTGHWWTHEKTSKGKDYYQEGNKVYSELNVVEAFHKALNTWAKWVDHNVNSKKSLVFFRGYSASHFSGGQWNSGGACDQETDPIRNETYLSPYPSKMIVLEQVLKGMKTRVSYLNITRMTDYRKDAHPSVYRKQHLTAEERRDPLSFQDCSHWCLPGVPDSWNELLYAQLIVKQYQMAH